MLRVPTLSAFAIAAGLAVAGAPAPAAAHSHHGSGHHHYHHHPAFIGAVPLFLPQPVYYRPPGTVIVVPTPLYSAPWPDECRTFQGNAVVAGTGQPFAGVACWQPDGHWHIVGG